MLCGIYVVMLHNVKYLWAMYTGWQVSLKTFILLDKEQLYLWVLTGADDCNLEKPSPCGGRDTGNPSAILW